MRDFANFARKQGIYFGVRGSAAGSMASYCIGITDVDPIEYGLTFERFLNPERISMPDIDMDFEDGRRQEVIDYVVGKYGRDRVAQIITFGTLAARAAVRDAWTARWARSPMPEVDKLCKMIPIQLPSRQLHDRRCPGRGHPASSRPARTTATPQVRRPNRHRHAGSEGLTRHDSVHAAGVVISAEDPLWENDAAWQKADGAASGYIAHGTRPP